MVRQLLTYKSDVPKKKKSSSELLCCCASTQLMQFQGFQNHFAILLFLGSKSICSHSKGRFAFLCNEAKNNNVLVFLKESSEVYEKWNAWSNLRILCLLWLAMNHLICIRIFLFFWGPAAGFICKPIFAFSLLPAYINKKKIFSRRKLVSWLC